MIIWLKLLGKDGLLILTDHPTARPHLHGCLALGNKRILIDDSLSPSLRALIPPRQDIRSPDAWQGFVIACMADGKL